jgi:hypothetical protein
MPPSALTVADDSVYPRAQRMASAALLAFSFQRDL